MPLTTRLTPLLLSSAVALSAASTVQAEEDEVKIGFIVKKPEQAWFINEQEAATEVGEEMGFEVVRMGGEDGQAVLSAIDNLNSQGAEGFVICPPDVRLGPTIMNRAEEYDMKVVTVDDRFVDSNGDPMEEVPHLGMSGYKIGEQVGKAIHEEMQERGWDADNVAALRITNEELPTAVKRTTGASDVLIDNGFPEDNILDAPQENTDTDSAFSAAAPVISQNEDIEHWIIYALNEESVLGGVRATEQYGIDAEDVIGVGINGSGAAFAEFSRDEPTGFHGTIAVSSTMHGRETAENLYQWITEGEKPKANTETKGKLMTRNNWEEVREELGL